MSAQVRYRELFRVDLRHGYFGDAPSAALALAPTRSCQRQLQQLGCRVQSGPGRSAVWIAERKGEAAALDLPAAASFGFLIQASDAQFVNYTQRDWLGPEPVSDLLYLSSADAQADENADLNLPSARGNVLPVRHGRFRHELAQKANGQPITLVRQADGTTVQSLAEPVGDGRVLNLDLSDVPDGRYALRVAADDVFDFLLSDASPSAAIGLMEIFPGAQGLDWSRSADAAPQRLSVQFEAHAVTWRYVLVAQNTARPLQDAAVECLRGQYNFGPSVPFDVRGKPAFAITSEQPIPLSAAPASVYPFVLRLPSTDGVPQEPIKLPYGMPEAIRYEEVAGVRQAIVNIYVYL